MNCRRVKPEDTTATQQLLARRLALSLNSNPLRSNTRFTQPIPNNVVTVRHALKHVGHLVTYTHAGSSGLPHHRRLSARELRTYRFAIAVLVDATICH